MKDKFIQLLTTSTSCVLILLYFSGVYHSYIKHPIESDKWSPLWGVYRGVEQFWHDDSDFKSIEYYLSNGGSSLNSEEEKPGFNKFIKRLSSYPEVNRDELYSDYYVLFYNSALVQLEIIRKILIDDEVIEDVMRDMGKEDQELLLEYYKVHEYEVTEKSLVEFTKKQYETILKFGDKNSLSKINKGLSEKAKDKLKDFLSEEGMKTLRMAIVNKGEHRLEEFDRILMKKVFVNKKY